MTMTESGCRQLGRRPLDDAMRHSLRPATRDLGERQCRDVRDVWRSPPANIGVIHHRDRCLHPDPAMMMRGVPRCHDRDTAAFNPYQRRILPPSCTQPNTGCYPESGYSSLACHSRNRIQALAPQVANGSGGSRTGSDSDVKCLVIGLEIPHASSAAAIPVSVPRTAPRPFCTQAANMFCSISCTTATEFRVRHKCPAHVNSCLMPVSSGKRRTNFL